MSKVWRHGGLRQKLGRALGCALLALAAVPAADAAARPPIETIVQDDAALLHRPTEDIAQSMAKLKELGVDRVRITAGWSVIAPSADSPTRPEGFDAADPNAYPQGKWDNLDRAVRLAQASGLEVMIDVAFWAPLWATQGDPNNEGGRARWNINIAEYVDFTKAVVRRYSGSFRPPAPDTGQTPPPEQPSRDQNWVEQLFAPGGQSSGSRTSARSSSSGDPLAGLFGGGQQQEPEQQQEQPQPQPQPAPTLDPLPAVKWWTIWNEPNHPGFVQPQWERTSSGWRPRSPHIYRRMVEAAYPAIKGLQPDSVVLVGGTSSTGPRNPRNQMSGVQPLRFVRELACVDERLRPITTGDCAGFKPVLGDGFAHHPYSLMHKPDHRDPRNPDNLPVGALDRLTDTLDRLAKMGRIDPKLRNLFLTEFGYESNPPDPVKPWNLDQQAKFLNWSEYLAWRNPQVRSWPQFLLRDMGVVSSADADRGKREFGDWQSGLLFLDGREKPSATSFKLALFAECVQGQAQPARRSRSSRRRKRARRAQATMVRIWGHIRPGAGSQDVRLTARDAGRPWSVTATAARLRVRGIHAAQALPFQTNPVGMFVRYAPYERGTEYRLERTLEGGGAEAGLAVRPVGCGSRRA